MPRRTDTKALLPVSQLMVVAAVAAGLLTACEGESPRSYSEYLEDPIAREATLLRCNASRDVSRGDAECINAKRAATALAAQHDAEKSRRLEAESERKRAALRERIAAQQASERRQLSEMKRRANLAYEQNWSYSDGGSEGVADYPEEGMGLSPQRDVYRGQQFPAAPLQPGVSDPSEQNSSGAVANYLGGEAQPGYSLSNGAEVIEPESVAAVPLQQLSEESSPPVLSAPMTESHAVPPPQQLTEDSSAADPSWQPFEPPAADQPDEG